MSYMDRTPSTERHSCFRKEIASERNDFGSEDSKTKDNETNFGK